MIPVCLFTLLIIAYALFIKRPKSPLLILALSLVLSGAVSNLIDRLFYGYVLDFIDLRFWPVFNIADSAITIGVLLMLAYLIAAKHKT